MRFRTPAANDRGAIDLLNLVDHARSRSGLAGDIRAIRGNQLGHPCQSDNDKSGEASYIKQDFDKRSAACMHV